MFEHDYSAAIFQGVARDNARKANQNAGLAEAWNREALKWQEAALKLDAAVKERDGKLLQAYANARGLTAQLEAMKSSAPDCSAMADSGQRYQSGSMKTVGRIAYEQAHDQYLRDNGVSNPEDWRS